MKVKPIHAIQCLPQLDHNLNTKRIFITHKVSLNKENLC